MHRIAFLAALSAAACTTPPLEERLPEADKRVVPCSGGVGSSWELTVSGVARDLDGRPSPNVRIDLTTAWGGAPRFPMNGCLLETTVTDAEGRFGPVKVRTATGEPIIVALASGEGLAPTLADRRGGCLFGCMKVEIDVVTVPAEVATSWREEMYADGMEYALNRGLVAYQFLGADGKAAAGVTPWWQHDSPADAEDHRLDPDEDMRFLASSTTLAAPGTAATTSTGYALVGHRGNERGYYELRGTRGRDSWRDVGVIEATGWIYFESDTVSR